MTDACDRRRWLALTALWCAGSVTGCGGGGGTAAVQSGAADGGTTGTGSDAGAGSPATPVPWTLAQSNRKNWQWHTPAWEGGNTLELGGVSAGSTLVLCAWGYVGQGGAGFRQPIDSQGQTPVLAADAGLDARVPVQAQAWVLHNAIAGAHQWRNLPDFGTQGFGDGVAVLMEFKRDGTPSTAVVGAGVRTLNDLSAPWFSEGEVTMSAGAAAGELLVACSFEEELTQGSAQTTYTHPPAGWQGVAVQTDSSANIAGEVCWRLAPDSLPQTVGWRWTYAANQDPTIFKALVFAVR